MKHLIKATLGFGLALGLWQVPADANLLNLKKKELNSLRGKPKQTLKTIPRWT